MKKRLLSALLTFCMLLTLLPVSAFAVDKESETYEAVEFEQIDELDGNQSQNQGHTIAYAIWTDSSDNYYLAISAQKNINVSLPDGLGSAEQFQYLSLIHI